LPNISLNIKKSKLKIEGQMEEEESKMELDFDPLSYPLSLEQKTQLINDLKSITVKAWHNSI